MYLRLETEEVVHLAELCIFTEK